MNHFKLLLVDQLYIYYTQITLKLNEVLNYAYD